MEIPINFQKMAQRGLRVDVKGLDESIASRRDALEAEKIRLHKILGRDPWSKNLLGGPANKNRLKTLNHPEALNIVSFREKDRSFKNLVSMRSRVYKETLKWEWTVATTTRYYATGGLLTISRDCREFIIPWDSENFYLWDYKSQELRIIAVITKAPRLWEILEKGKDPHEITSKISNRSRDEGKTINYAYMYGMEPSALMKIYSMNDRQMRMVDAVLPMQLLTKIALEKANWAEMTITNIFGTVVKFEEVKHLASYYVQSVGADILRRAVDKVMGEMGIWIDITVHDALLTEDDNPAIGEAMTFTLEGMEFPVEMKAGPNWGAVT